LAEVETRLIAVLAGLLGDNGQLREAEARLP
jgi:hypothetical protein